MRGELVQRGVLSASWLSFDPGKPQFSRVTVGATGRSVKGPSAPLAASRESTDRLLARCGMQSFFHHSQSHELNSLFVIDHTSVLTSTSLP